jgi:hypothetical protein
MAVALPIDVINRIMELKSSFENKKYVPVFSQKGKINWKFNKNQSGFVKLSEIYKNRLQNVKKYPRVEIGLRTMEATSILIKSGNILYYEYITLYSENKIEYMMFHYSPKLDGILIYGTYYEKWSDTILRQIIITNIRKHEDNTLECIVSGGNLGIWQLNHQTNMVEYIINIFDDMDYYSGVDEEDDSENINEFAYHNSEYGSEYEENAPENSQTSHLTEDDWEQGYQDAISGNGLLFIDE